MLKQVLHSKEAIDRMMAGMDKVANTVTATYGPKGKNVYLYDSNIIKTKISNDGVSIANEIILEDKVEDAGAFIIRNVSAQQLDDVGDGTTLVTLLTQKIIQECLKRPENPMEVRSSLIKARDNVLKLLKKRINPIKKEDVKKVALISAEDDLLATKITEIFNKLGDKAVINVEDSKTYETYYDIVEGYEANVGFMSDAFINERKGSRSIQENISVFCTQKKISSLADIAPLFNKLQEQKITSLVIVCEDIDDSILGIFVNNFRMKLMNLLVIRATGPLLEDIAGVVGAKILSDSTGITFQNFQLDSLGKAKKIVCDANKTIFIGTGKSKKYIDDLEARANSEPNMYTAKTMKQRVAKLKGGIAVLKIGSPTDSERGYIKDKAEDAVKATQAALEEGIVEGGGMTLWRISQEINPKTIGEEILKKVFKSPLKKITENAGKEYEDIARLVLEQNGYDAKNDKYVNMIESGIIDPVKVIRCAIINSISTASSFITINSLVLDAPEKK